MIQRLLFPISLALALAASFFSLWAGLSPGLLPIIATGGALTLVLLAEQRWPRIRRSAEAKEVQADVGFAVLSAVVDAGSTALVATLAVLLSTVLGFGSALELHLGLAVPLALLLGGIGDYWAHRLSHEWGWWWKLHSVHHAPHRMVALNNLRLHPVDLLLKTTATLLPVLIVGFSAEALALMGVVKGLNVAFQHANLDLRHGWMNYVMATNSVHRWHHSANAEEANANYGGVLVVYDLLFRTFHLPAESAEPVRMGLFIDDGYPIHQVWRASIAPLCWSRCTGRNVGV